MLEAVGAQMQKDSEAPCVAEPASALRTAPSVQHVLALQRSAGNRAVARLIAPAVAPIRAQAMSRVIQRNPKAKAKPTYVPYQIHVDRPMSRDEFRALAMNQIFGGARDGIEWKGGQDAYSPDKSPYAVSVEAGLVRAQRAQASQERGVTLGEDGRIAGAEVRAEEFQDEPASDEKSALMDEIDRRYFEATGDRTQTKIKRGEPGKAELWRAIRDEVLFQHEYLGNLPANAKAAIKVSIKGRELTPADYDRLFAIAKKIEHLPPGQASDYASKVTASTTDLDVFEASLDTYTGEMAERAKQGEERDKVQTKLAGLDEFYKRYRTYKDLLTSGSMAAGAGMSGMPGAAGTGIGISIESGKLRAELDTEVKRHGFADLADFEAFIKRYEQAFERESVNIAQDLLKKYAGKLGREAERYGDPGEVQALYQKLGGMRAQYVTFETNAKVWNDYAKNSPNDPSRIPGQGHLQPKVSYAEADAARQKAEAAKAAAQTEVQGLAGEHPILQEDGLPIDKRIDKSALAKASESELGGVLQRHVQSRVSEIGDANAEIEGNHELIYKMEKLMPQFYAQQRIKPGSIHDMIIQDKLRSDAILKLAKGIALAFIGIALAVVTFGTATPAILAAGAAIAGAGLGVYSALEEYNEYTQQQALADVGLGSHPSVVWLVVAIVGAGLDVAAAASAVRALGPAAKALDAGGDLAAFTKTVEALERANQIEAKVARSAEKAAAARKGLSEARGELTKAMAGKAYGFPGPLTDPEVHRAVVKMARQAIKTAVYDAQKFIDELDLARVKAGLGNLSPEELTKAKQAWEEAKALEAAENARYQNLLKQVPDAAKLDALIKQAGDAEKLERLLKVFPQSELETIFAKASDPTKLALMLDSVGSETSVSTVRVWMRDGDIAKMDTFLKGLASREGKELAETSALTSKSVMLDSNLAISLEKEALGTGNPAHKSRAAFVKSLPPDTEIRVGNATLGELGSDALKVKGVPLSVARDSTEYKEVLNALENVKVQSAIKNAKVPAKPVQVGTEEGFLDRGLIADAFFAKTDPGVITPFVTADSNVVKTLVNLGDAAAQKVFAAKGFPGLVAEFSPKGGFKVTITLSGGGQRSIMVVPVR